MIDLHLFFERDFSSMGGVLYKCSISSFSEMELHGAEDILGGRFCREPHVETRLFLCTGVPVDIAITASLR